MPGHVSLFCADFPHITILSFGTPSSSTFATCRRFDTDFCIYAKDRHFGDARTDIAFKSTHAPSAVAIRTLFCCMSDPLTSNFAVVHLYSGFSTLLMQLQFLHWQAFLKLEAASSRRRTFIPLALSFDSGRGRLRRRAWS